MALRIFQVDAFANKPFSGNPATVCLLSVPQDTSWLQDVAREMNQAATAFVLRREGEDAFDLRWFSPIVELELCGHGTLSSAYVLWNAGHLKADEPARFHTLAGLLIAERKGEWIELKFPTLTQEAVDSANVPADLLPALGVSATYIGKSQLDYLVEVESEDILRAINPDFARLSNVDARGIIVTSRASTREYDFVSRFFAPRRGMNEDFVTGSAHCCLAPYWSPKLDQTELVGYQASSRGGIIRTRLAQDHVYLSGQAIMVSRGDLL
jgi:PhzF family phenazine biosynthesis protein